MSDINHGNREVICSICIVMGLWTLGARFCEGPVVLAQGIARPDLPEQASRPDTFDGDTWLVLRPVDYVWVACAIGANVLFFVRMIILFAYGYGIRYFDWVYQHRKLREIARKQTSERRRRIFNLINVLIPVLLIIAGIVLFLARMAVPIVRGLVVPTLNRVIQRISSLMNSLWS
jgi:hypothetical protein